MDENISLWWLLMFSWLLPPGSYSHSESIDLQELDKVVGEDPEFSETFSGNNEEGESDTVPRTLGKGNSTSTMSDLL